MTAPQVNAHEGLPDDRDNVRLWLRLLTCTRIIEKSVKRGFADEYNSTLPRFDVMAALERRPEGMTMGQLSKALLVSNGNVTGVVQVLVRDRYVSLTPSPTDGRSSVARLTRLGRDHFAVLAEAHRNWVETMLAGLGREDRSQLYQSLGVLKDLLADNGETE
ncbi:MarR family winged helix-turn-helix transcriptional regulator [Sphingomonas soli]|uniref:MarR family winged helix-turn-helix transcriptional regulator n=1 Tax=Sphingomonas soli TaxID=266127 RepID=UPI00083257FE|nr:MarR family transcriptional regulator [Sphingomonas soli]